jgi:hypothetical protein
MGTGSINIACARWGRNSIGIELDAKYYEIARHGVAEHGADLFVSSCLKTRVHDHARSLTVECRGRGGGIEPGSRPNYSSAES